MDLRALTRFDGRITRSEWWLGIAVLLVESWILRVILGALFAFAVGRVRLAFGWGVLGFVGLGLFGGGPGTAAMAAQVIYVRGFAYTNQRKMRVAGAQHSERGVTAWICRCSRVSKAGSTAPSGGWA